MELTQQVAIVAAMGFFLVGLLSGVWKYFAMRRSPEGMAPVYVDTCHRASLLYAFACLLLERMVELSALPLAVELAALAALLGFFAFAVFTYAVHGWLNDTDNQIKPPHRLGRLPLPGWMVPASMVALIAAEIGGFVVLAGGVVAAL